MRDLLKKVFELSIETHWIKMITKEERKLERLKDAVKRQKYVVDRLHNEFLKRYPVEEE